MMNAMFGAVFAIPLLLLWISLIGLTVYSMVLFIKLATRGITAFDIYISKNQGGNRIE